jgi:hypothetical protein
LIVIIPTSSHILLCKLIEGIATLLAQGFDDSPEQVALLGWEMALGRTAALLPESFILTFRFLFNEMYIY